MDYAEIIVLGCAMKHGETEGDIRHAVRFPKAARYRNFDPPAHIAIAGADESGNVIEVLGAEQEDGSLVVFHAMKLTKKMARELML